MVLPLLAVGNRGRTTGGAGNWFLARSFAAEPLAARTVGRQAPGNTSSTASRVAATTMSVSASVRQSGGAKPTQSPCGMARALTPRFHRAAATQIGTTSRGDSVSLYV